MGLFAWGRDWPRPLIHHSVLTLELFHSIPLVLLHAACFAVCWNVARLAPASPTWLLPYLSTCVALLCLVEQVQRELEAKEPKKKKRKPRRRGSDEEEEEDEEEEAGEGDGSGDEHRGRAREARGWGRAAAVAAELGVARRQLQPPQRLSL